MTSKQYWSARVQEATMDHCLWAVSVLLRDIKSPLLKLVKFAFLNRACELSEVPLTQYYVDTTSGDIDTVWVTYRPEAIPNSPRTIPDAMVYLGSVDTLTETEARSRSLGW